MRWIFVRDIPNLNLRHIKLKYAFLTRYAMFENLISYVLSNTQERKPVTNSRDTQELLPDAGQEMLKIFHTHPARTSLLQDFAFYEVRLSCHFLWEIILKKFVCLASSNAKDASYRRRSHTFATCFTFTATQ